MFATGANKRSLIRWWDLSWQLRLGQDKNFKCSGHFPSCFLDTASIWSFDLYSLLLSITIPALASSTSWVAPMDHLISSAGGSPGTSANTVTVSPSRAINSFPQLSFTLGLRAWEEVIKYYWYCAWLCWCTLCLQWSCSDSMDQGLQPAAFLARTLTA